MNKALTRTEIAIFWAFAITSLVSLMAAAFYEQPLFVLAPVGIIFSYFLLTDFRKIFLLLLAFLPLSMEFYMDNGLATDLPTEPLMVVMMFVFILYAVLRPEKLDVRFFLHPLILVLLLHFLWIFITALNSEEVFRSLKYFAAKSWYIIVFVFLASLIIKDPRTFRPAFWSIFIPLLAVTIVTMIRQSLEGFVFEDVNKHVVPYFRNHVNYATMITLFFPFVWLAASWYQKGTWKRWIVIFGRYVYIAAIIFAYTRACWLALAVAAVSYLIINRGWLQYALILAMAGAIGFFMYLSHQNTFLKYAPEFEKTLTFKNLDDHLAATYRLEDASSMERFYRWIAAAYMVADKPFLGYGPGNYYPSYQSYTVDEFETYISDNEEQSTVHNYFLLMLVEQGFPGLIIFVLLTYAIFFYGQRIYSRTRIKEDKHFIMALLLSMIIIYVNLVLSDMIEVDKTGTFFFLIIALLVNMHLKLKEEHAEVKSLPKVD